jgi:hypothetical protein
MKSVGTQSFLMRCFKSACAIYLPTCFKVFAILAPIKNKSNDKFYPLFVSVKNGREFSMTDVDDTLDEMMNELQNNQVNPSMFTNNFGFTRR